MNTWLTPTCQWIAAGDGTASAIMCAVLAVLLLAVIALGFGPLRTWLGLGEAVSRSSNRSVSETYDLRATWRLYRQLRHADRSTAPFSVPDVPVRIVPDSMREGIRKEQLPLEPTSTLRADGQSVTRAARLELTVESTHSS